MWVSRTATLAPHCERCTMYGKQVQVQLLLLLLQSHSGLQSFISPNKLPPPDVWLRIGRIRWYFSTGFCGRAKGVLKKAWSQVSYRFIMACAFTRLQLLLLLFAFAQLIHLDPYWLVAVLPGRAIPTPATAMASDLSLLWYMLQYSNKSNILNAWALYRYVFPWTTSIQVDTQICIIAE